MNREKVYLVDEDDNVIGEKWRNELTDKDCWRIAMIWVTDTEGDSLLEQRSFRKSIHPGEWTAASVGTVPAGEAPTETAVRELKEEIGVEAALSDLEPTGKVHYKDSQSGFRIAYGFKLTIPHRPAGTFIIQKDELEQVRWYTPDELSRLRGQSTDMKIVWDQYEKLGFI